MCGIVGLWNITKAAEHAAFALHAEQHRARDYAGIMTSDGEHAYRHAGAGIASVVFNQKTLDQLHGHHAIGHLRYPTVNDDEQRDNTQPIQGFFRHSWIGVAHNGNLTNVEEIKHNHLSSAKFATSMDTECIVRLITEEGGRDGVLETIARALSKVRGSYALTVLLPDRLLAIRDPSGNRPLVWGKYQGGYAVASETCALTALGIYDHTEVPAGYILSFGENGVEEFPLVSAPTSLPSRCVFELTYYSMPTSRVFGISTTKFRLELGRELAHEHPVEADIVMAIPDSSNAIAAGYAAAQPSTPYAQFSLLRNHYTGRSFIASTPELRRLEVSRKFLFDPEEVLGRRIILVDDSIVRLNTLPKVIANLKEMGATEVHVRIGCPPVTHPCIYGINTPTKAELIASHCTVDEMRELSGATTLAFLSLAGLRKVVDRYVPAATFCYACMDGNYPLPT